MKFKAAVAAYPVAFIVMLAVMVVLGAMALSLIFTGSPAFPVTVFGSAGTRGSISAVRWIRPVDAVQLPRGRMDTSDLLPLPPPPPVFVDKNADPLYAELAKAGLQGELDRARLAAQKQDAALSLAAYARLTQRFPANRRLLLEHASVLSQFGQNRRAAQLLAGSFARFPGDAELRILAARNYWWSGDALKADSIVNLALALDPGSAEANRLLETVRPATTPDIATALRWVRERNRPLENLILARAYVRAERYAEALPYYRASTRTEVGDSLLLEVASAAAAADSLAYLDELTSRYLQRHPDELEPRLRLARAYSWRKDYDTALRYYDEVLSRSTDTGVLLEKANVLVWSGRERDAERELNRVLVLAPRNPEALKLLGDLASYRGDWDVALRHYRTVAALNPTFPGLGEAIANAEEAAEKARLAALPQPEPDRYALAFDSYSDNRNYGWFAAQASRSFRIGASTLSATASQSVTRSEIQPQQGAITNPGIGFAIQATTTLSERVLLAAAAGLTRFDVVGTFPSAALALTVYDVLGTTATVRLAHEPAMRRATSLVALYARATSDIVQVTASRSAGEWSVWTQGEAERIASRVGPTTRYAVAANVQRNITKKLAAGVTLSALTVRGSAPVLPGYGALYWTPEYYVEPSLSLSYRENFGTRWVATGGFNLGYGFARERAQDQRFARGSMPTGSASLDVGYTNGPWTISVGGAYGGALREGYRSGSVRLQASYSLHK